MKGYLQFRSNSLLYAAGNHLEAIPSGLQHLVHLIHLGLALNYYKSWCHAAPCFGNLANTLQVGAAIQDDELIQCPQLHKLGAWHAGSHHT